MAKKTIGKDSTVEEKLDALANLQNIDSEIDRIKTIRGELPLEVQDLEDEIAGLETREAKYMEEIENLEKAIISKQNAIKDSQLLIKKYEEKQMKVRNNREYDSISKEIEYQNLEIELAEKRIKEFTAQLNEKKIALDESKQNLKERRTDLDHKKTELDQIVSETKNDEEALNNSAAEVEKKIEKRLLSAYKRIRGAVRNGLAVVPVQRDACGGCFNKIPPQRQLDIRSRKKIIVCEYCGRILVDPDIDDHNKKEEDNDANKDEKK